LKPDIDHFIKQNAVLNSVFFINILTSMRTYLLLALLGICLLTWAQSPEEINPQLPGQNMMSIMASPQIIEDPKNSYLPTDNFAPQQVLSIPQGWSGISGFVIPDNPNIEFLMKPHMDRFVILYNQNGMYYPEQNINTLVNWNPQSGYIAKFSQPASMGLSGQVNTNRTITLNAGWNLIPVLSNCPVNVAEFFQNQDLVVVKDVATYKLYWPVMGINTLNELLPSKAYYVLMSAPGVITFPDCTVPAWQCGEPFVDPRDNRVYNTIQIGTQCWMSQNLNYGNRVNGNQLQLNNSTPEKYCYNNQESNCNIYGGLYQWNEIMQYTELSGSQGLCPDGWYIPNEQEWSWLVNYLGGGNTAGGELKVNTGSYWSQPNTGATNSTGFNGMPGGQREISGLFSNQNYFGNFWTSTNSNAISAIRTQLSYNNAQLLLTSVDKNNGFSVRCLKKEPLTINPGTLSISHLAGTYSVELTSFSTWTVEENIPWLSVSPISGISNAILTITISENTSVTPRSGQFNISSYGQTLIVTVLVEQEGTPPVISVIPSSQNFTYQAGSEEFMVQSNTSWIVEETVDWLTVTPMNGEYNSLLSVVYDENPLALQRTGEIAIIATGGEPVALITLIQEAAPPSIQVTPSNQTVTYLGGTTSFNLSSNTSWTINENADWLTVSPITGLYNGNIEIVFDTNFSASPRNAEVIITANGGSPIDSITISQEGAPPLINVNTPTKIVNYQAGTVEFIITSNTSWNIDENIDWLNVSPLSGNHDGVITVNYAENNSILQRLGEITVIAEGGSPVVSLILSQQAAPPALSVTPISQNVTNISGTAFLVVSSNTTWSVTENVPWLTVSPVEGSNNDTIRIVYLANSDFSPRFGEITIVASGGTPAVNVTIEQDSKICLPSFQDNRDGKIYNTVLIVNQCWMAQNLNVGVLISDTANQSDNGFIEKYCNDDSEEQCNLYGGLYQWDEMMEYSNGFGVKGICPEGWRLPEASDWDELIQSLGGDLIAGGKMKSIGTVEAGTGLWFAPNTGASNSSGFNLQPAGYMYGSDGIMGTGYAAILWSSDYQSGYPKSYVLSYDTEDVFAWDAEVLSGFSVRCLLSDNAEIYTTVTPSQSQFSSETDSAIFVISSNTSWQVSDEVDWLSISPSSGSGNGQFNIKCEANMLTTPRSASVWVVSEGREIELTIDQADFVPMLTVSPTNLVLPYFPGTVSLYVQSNTNWTIEEDIDWIVVNSTGSYGNDTVIFIYEENSGNDYRFGQINFIASGGTPLITVSLTQVINLTCGNFLTDYRDNKTYNTVQICNQCWMAQNLNIGNRINGSSNPANNSIIEKYCYNNLEDQCDVYGGLYQWDEMMNYSTTAGVQGICPIGWHLPSDNDWNYLTNFVSSQPDWICGGEASYNAKAISSTTGWYGSNNTCAIGNDQTSNNAAGFNGLPGGYREIEGSFISKSNIGVWWSSSQHDVSNSQFYYLYYDYANVENYTNNKSFGVSVRCLKDIPQLEVTPTSQNVSSQAGTTTFTVTSNTAWTVDENEDWLVVSPISGNGDNTLTVNYDENMLTESRSADITITAWGGNPIVIVSVTQAGAPEPWSCGQDITDERDGQIYPTVLIGEQCWMAQNLNVGTMVEGYIEQSDNGIPEKYCYDNLEANCDVYGGLYQWNEMMQYTVNPGSQGICPSGWHVPNQSEWLVLNNYLGNQSGGKLKETGTAHWISPNYGATNSSGFTALPGGIVNYGSFSYLGNYVFFGTSSQYYYNEVNYYWYLGYDLDGFGFDFIDYQPGISVRCLKGETSISEINMPGNIYLSTEAGSYSFTASANTAWNIVENEPWFSVSPMSGSNSTLITINYNENTDLSHRQGFFTIYSDDGTILATSIIYQFGNSQISVSPDYVEVGSESGFINVNVYSNDSWSAYIEVPWLSVSPESGFQDGIISIGYEANDSHDPRGDYIYIYTADGVYAFIYVYQQGYHLYITPDERGVSNGVGSCTFDVITNTSWIVEENIDWLSVSPSSGTNNGTLTVNYNNNNLDNYRVGQITVMSEDGSFSVSVIITQAGQSFTCGLPFIDTLAAIAYNTVQIGTQCWMSQNLNVGNMIPGDGNQTNNGTIEKYCYNNDEANCDVYGGLYQWEEMMQYTEIEGCQGICPGEWHIPTYGEFITMVQYLGGPEVAGGHMKETGTIHWDSPNIGATNSSGFSAFGSGLRNLNGMFVLLGVEAIWWSSKTNFGTTNIRNGILLYGAAIDISSFWDDKLNAVSIRCLKN